MLQYKFDTSPRLAALAADAQERPGVLAWPCGRAAVLKGMLDRAAFSQAQAEFSLYNPLKKPMSNPAQR